MIDVIDWYGKTQRIDPSDFANEECRYPATGKYGQRWEMVKTKEIIKYCGYDDTKTFYETPDYPAIYLYHRIIAEAELSLGWRIHNGYHKCEFEITVDDIAKAVDHYTTIPHENKMSSCISYDQRVELGHLIFSVDQALYKTYTPSDIKKMILFAYAICVKNQPPEVAFQACRSADARYYLDKYGVENKAWQREMDDRIVKERKKLKLD